MQKLTVVTIGKYIQGWLEDDELKIKSYRDFIESNFSHNKIAEKLLGISSKADAYRIGQEIATEYSINGKDRCYRIMQNYLKDDKNSNDVVSLQ